MHRSHARWQTPLGRWVCTMTVPRIAKDLRSVGVIVTEKAIYNWIAGDRQPRLDVAAHMVRISGGMIRFEDLVEHYTLMHAHGEPATKATKAKEVVAEGSTPQEP